MKREILCPDCNALYLSIAGTPMGDSEEDNKRRVAILSSPQEYCKRVHGIAKHSCHCDGCGIQISNGDMVIARSSWADYTPGYYEWESEYVVPDRSTAVHFRGR